MISQFYTFLVSPVMQGILLCMCMILIVAFFLKKYPRSYAMILVDFLYEKVAAFYGEILGDGSGTSIRTYVVALFFVILIANLTGVLLDFMAPIFGVSPSGDFYLTQYIVVPTADMQFNIALAFFSTILLVGIQFRSLGVRHFFYNYVPFWGKGYIVVARGKMKPYLYYPAFFIAKIGDIIISLFLGFLDIIGLFAKVISLAFRLFGNMTSGTVLLGMLIVGSSSISVALTQFWGGIELPIILPIIVHLQQILVACIQAMVFPLLVAIFIRMAQLESQSSKQVEV